MIRRSFRIGLLLGVLGGAVLALVRAMQGQRQPAPVMEPARQGPWPPMEPPQPQPRAHEERVDPVHGDPLVPHDDVRQTTAPEPTPEPVVPEPEPEPLHPQPAPAPPTPDQPEPSPIIPDEPPTEPIPSATTAAMPSARETIQARKELSKKLAAKKAVAKKSVASKTTTPRKAAGTVTKKAKPPAKAPVRVWVEPVGGVCPDTHPIKAKLSSKLFHLPGMFAYERCNPDRCYGEERGAEADGLRRAKR